MFCHCPPAGPTDIQTLVKATLSENLEVSLTNIGKGLENYGIENDDEDGEKPPSSLLPRTKIASFATISHKGSTESLAIFPSQYCNVWGGPSLLFQRV